jgi:hypothetical protein
MSMLPFFEWMQGLRFSAFFLESIWPTPIMQNIHLIAIAVFAGSVLVVDLRVLGRGLVDTPLPQLARMAEPWLIGSFAVLVLSGIPQMASTALKQYYSPFFWWKMQAVLLGVILTVTVRRRLLMRTDAELGPVWPKVVALVSLALWTSVMIGARLIGLMG